MHTNFPKKLLQLVLLVIAVLKIGAQNSLTAQNSFTTMQTKLAEILLIDTFPGHQCINEQGIKFYKEKLREEGKENYISNLMYLSKELVKSGETDSAIQVSLTLIDSIKSVKHWHLSNTRQNMEYEAIKNLALCYLRLGEQRNCYHNHNPYSCIMPFAPAAFHVDKTGSEKAIELYTELLLKKPDDYISKWLLNIAYMTLGKYPDSVPSVNYIDFNKYQANFSVPYFENIADIAKVNAFCQLGGANIEDFNNDGYLDLFTTSYKLSDNPHLYLNKGNGQFEDVTEKAGLIGITGGVNTNHADYDNDGDIDIFIIRGGWLLTAIPEPNSLLRNNGDGSFSDVTMQAGLLTYGFRHTANWGDFNNDGWLDLFVGNEKEQHSNGKEYYPRSELYLNNRDGTFKEVSESCGINIQKWVKGSTWGDYNNDGLIDLYVSSIGSKNQLFKNNGCNKSEECLPTFTEVADEANVSEPILSFGTFFFDFNNDGWQDLYVTGYSNENFEIAQEYLGLSEARNPPCLYLNKRDGTFENISKLVAIDRSIYAMGMNFGDIDNDGWLDVFAGTGYAALEGLLPNIMLRNNNGLNFQDVTSSGGFGMLQKGHGIAFGDVDNDGDQDIYMNSGGFLTGDKFWNLLLHNPGNSNNWITLSLEGASGINNNGFCNKSAVGTKIKLTLKTKSGLRNLHIVVGTGGCYGASSLLQEIGLGDALAIEEIEITWHGSKTIQVFKSVKMNTSYKLKENNSNLTKIEKTKFNLLTNTKEKQTNTPHHHHH